jgi:ABC-2 type transport system permease protein
MRGLGEKIRRLIARAGTREGGRLDFGTNLELLHALVFRELRSRYRGSYLGWLWALVRPLVMLGVYALIVGVFLGAARVIPEFMIFIFVGLMAWNLFASIVTGSISGIVSSASLISKAPFPRILIPTAALVVALVDTLFQVTVLAIGYLIVGEWPAMQSLAYLVPAFLGVVLFGLAVGLILAALNVYIKDVSFLTDVGLQVGFWMCPIVYSYGFIVSAAETYGWSVAWVTRIYMLNPMANAVVGFQRGLWPPASTPDGADFSFPGQLEWRLFLLVAIGVLVLAIAVWVFQRLSRNFAQEL